MNWFDKFQKTRKRLYWLLVAINLALLDVLISTIVLGDQVRPLLSWPVDIARVFVPGLGEALVAATMKFPVLGILVIMAGTTYWASRFVKAEEQEWAIQGWRHSNVFGQNLAPGTTIRIMARVSFLFPVVSFPVLALNILALIVLLCLAIQSIVALLVVSNAVPGQQLELLAPATSTCCIHSSGPRRLGAGEAVEITVVAKQKHNKTGLLLAEGERYSTRYVAHEGWRDGGHVVEPTGVDFEGYLQFLARSIEWLRPYPDGRWFQVIGRVDGEHTVFPVLDARDETKPHEFRAPDDGELLLFVNDVWYRNNSGFMTLNIRRAPDHPPTQ